MNTIPISRTVFDNKIWEVQKYLMGKYGCDRGTVLIDPLKWYINTGRASVYFLHAFLNTKVYMTARRLAKAGTHDEIIDSLKKLYNL
jgi:hypothetical protein